jgi:hypothetical protein
MTRIATGRHCRREASGERGRARHWNDRAPAPETSASSATWGQLELDVTSGADEDGGDD